MHQLFVKGDDDKRFRGWGILQTNHGSLTPNDCCPFFLSSKHGVNLKPFNSHFEWSPAVADMDLWIYYVFLKE